MEPTEEKSSASAIYSTLYGLRSSLIRNFSTEPFNLRELPVVLTDNAKAALRRKLTTALQSDSLLHPYMYLELATVEAVKDQNAYKTIQKLGYVNRHVETASSLSRGFLFPAKISTNFHYVDNDIERTLQFVEQLLLLSHSGNLNFTLIYAGSHEWVGNVSCDDSVSFPKASLEDPSQPGELDVSITLSVDTKIGFVKSVYRVNEQAPTVNINSPMPSAHGGHRGRV
jgi:hypothetical protein